MIKKTILSVAGLMLFAVGIWAADSSYTIFDTATQERKQIKLIDNGDGTYSQSVQATAGALVGSDYALHSKIVTAAPDSLTFNGTGVSWAFEVRGGSATFTVAGSSSTTAFTGQTYSDTFEPVAANPVLSLTFLQSGATAQLIISGGV